MNLLSAVIDTISAHQFFPQRISLILVKDFYKENKSDLPDQLKKSGYHKFSVEPQMILNIHPEWKTFDDYLLAMSKKYRNKTKTVLKKSCLLEEKEITYENYHQFSKSIISLYWNVAQKAGFKLAELNEEYFKVMLETYKDSFKMVAYFLDHKPVAFRSGFSLENHYEAHYIGLDYSINKEQCLYQRILYDFASDAIINQAKELHLGRTAAEMKSNIGAEPHDLIAYMRLRNGLTNKFVSPLIQFLRPTDAVYRSPFRQ